jgi:hypothetical protein
MLYKKEDLKHMEAKWHNYKKYYYQTCNVLQQIHV